MTRTFIQTNEFVKKWEEMGLTDEDLRRLELEIMKNPHAGTVIQGTGGLRKMRFAFEGSGKRGSLRVCYVDFYRYAAIYLITAYSKSEKDNLSKTECKEIKKMIDLLEKNMSSRRYSYE